MAVDPNAHFEFTDYQMLDEGVRMHFVSPDPGPGEASDYYLTLSDAELAGVTTEPQLDALVQSHLSRKIRATGISQLLDPYIGTVLQV